MKHLLIIASLLLATYSAQGAEFVQGHISGRGFVNSYIRSSPDSIKENNYGYHPEHSAVIEPVNYNPPIQHTDIHEYDSLFND